MRIFAFSFMLVILVAAFMLGCGQLPDEQMLTKGKEFESKEQFQKAIDMYDKLVSTYPKSPFVAEAIYQQANVYKDGFQNYPVAIAKYERVVADYPQDKFASNAQFMIGFTYANSVNDTAKARVAYQKFLNDYPEHELVSSVEWELKFLGKDINAIPDLMQLDTTQAVAEPVI